MSDTQVTPTTAEVPAEPALKSVDTKPASRGYAPDPEPAKPEPVQAEPEGAAEQQESSEDAAGDETHDDADTADSAKKKRNDPRWLKERIERVRRVTAAETREAMLREFLANQSAPQRTEATGPTLEDFNFDHEAFIAHKVQEGIKQEREREQFETQRQQQAKQAEQFQSKVEAFEERAGSGAWEELIHSPVNSDPKLKVLTDVFMGDDNDLDLAAHFADHLDEAYRIAALPPVQRAREVAKVADTLNQPAKPLPRKITNAPPPPTQVQGVAKPAPSEDDPDISTEQRIALWRAKRGQR